MGTLIWQTANWLSIRRLSQNSTPKTRRPWPAAELQTAVDDGADEVEKHHAEWWRFYWNRGYLAIDDDDAERGWYRALYICGSCLRAGKHSPGLQGAWIKEHQPAWRADYHANLNIQATYWSCFTANRLDLVEPLLAFYLSILPRCQRDTREFFEMEGSYLPHACDVFGNPTGNATVLPLLASMSPACWLASLFWDYYEYSGDLDYLREWGYPLLREVTRFTEDYLSFDDDKGTIAPSICWEVNTGSLEGWGVNSQYDLAAGATTVASRARSSGSPGERPIRPRALDTPSGAVARLSGRCRNKRLEGV